MARQRNDGKQKGVITSPEESRISDFSLSGNYYLSILVKDNVCTVSFVLCGGNTLVSFTFENFLSQKDLPESGWFGYGDSEELTNVLVPPDRPGFYVRKSDAIIPETATIQSKIYWAIEHEAKSMKVSWSDYPVIYASVGGSYPAMAFFRRGEGIFVGIGDTPDRAVLNAVHLSRVGVDRIRNECDSLVSRLPNNSHGRLVRNNLLVNLFYSNSRCLDREESCIIASKSPKYYVSTGFWARDFLFWSLSGIERLDQSRAKELLSLIFSKYFRNKGVHSLYVDGRVLYDGFELDELAAYFLAISKGLEYGLFDVEKAVTAANEILREIEFRKSPDFQVYSTELNSSDDPVEYPYVMYDNVVMWHSLVQLSNACSEGTDRHEFRLMASRMKHDILKCFVIAEENMFCYSTDLGGEFQLYDDPTGSLLMLPFLGFVNKNSKTFRNTVEWILSKRNKFRIPGTFAGNGNTHVFHPWIHYYASLLFLGDERGEEIFQLDLPGGFACETVDETSGRPRTGIHFPGASGFLAEAILSYENGKKVN